MGLQINPNYVVVSNTYLVVKQFLSIFDNHFTNLKKFYAPAMDTSSTLEVQKSTRSRDNNSNPVDMPLLFWSREPLSLSDLFGGRSQRPAYKIVDCKDLKMHNSVIGKMSMSFKMLFNNMTDLEVAELIYITTLTKVTSFTVNIPTLGDFSYQIDWQDISSLDVSNDEIINSSIMFSAEITGDFFLLTGTHPRLRQIVSSVYYTEDTSNLTNAHLIDRFRSDVSPCIPIANAGSSQVVSSGALVTLNGSASTNIAGTPLTYTWIVPSYITLSNSSSAPTFSAPIVQTETVFTVSLVVSDPNGIISKPDSISITITP